MGASASLGVTANEARRRSKSIDDSLEAEKARQAKTVQILLLGPSGAGKSTLARQIRIIYDKGFLFEERVKFARVVRQNVAKCVMTVLQTMEYFGVDFGEDDVEEEGTMVYNRLGYENAADVIIDIKDAVQRIVAHEKFQESFARSLEYRLHDSADYFFRYLDRILAPEFLPSDEDILRSRLQTNGVHETVFNFKGLQFRMCDVGGQRSETRKWIHCFDNVSAIIFTVAISGYDQSLVENENINELQDSLDQFHSICGQECFRDASVILFLNKTDIFEKKILRSPLNKCFPEYKGKNDYIDASRYIWRKFENALDGKTDLYGHFTNATDTDSIRLLFEDVIAVILKENTRDMHIY